MRAQQTAALADSHVHRDPSRLLRLRAEVMRDCTRSSAQDVVSVEIYRERTPGDDHPDGRVRPARDAERGEVADVVVGGHSEEEAVRGWSETRCSFATLGPGVMSTYT